jgi:hypothetical protein
MRPKRTIFIVLVIAAVSIFLFSSCMQNIEVIGSVIDNNGNPIQNATVKLMQGETLIQITQTDQKGDYLFSSVKPGTYKVKAEKEGYQQVISDFFNVGYGTTRVPLLTMTNTSGLNQYNIYGVASLADKDKGNWAGISIKLMKDTSVASETKTDNDGNYYFNGVYEGDYKLEFSMSGYTNIEKPVSLHGDTGIDVELMPSSSGLTIDQLISSGKTALYNDNIAYAEYCFKLAYAKDPTNIDANFGYSLTYGSTEIKIAVSRSVTVDTATKILKNTPLAKFIKLKDTSSSPSDNLRSVILDTMNKRTSTLNYVKTYVATHPTYEFDLLDDSGSVAVTFKLPEIFFYHGLLQSLSGVPQFLIDKFNFNFDPSRIKNAFDSGNGFADLDTNNDGIITPEEFFGSEFLKLRPDVNINDLDYEAALTTSASGVTEMLSALAMSTLSSNEALTQLGTDTETILQNIYAALTGPIPVTMGTYSGVETTININIPALFNNSNKIDDWKKLMPSIKLIKIRSDSSSDVGDTTYGLKNTLKGILKDEYTYSSDGTPEYEVVPDLISRHAYNFDAGKQWLFGANGFFSSTENQFDILDLALPPEIYGILEDTSGPIDNGIVAVGSKNYVDESVNSGQIPNLELIDLFKTYKSGYYSLPITFTTDSDKATDIYVISMKMSDLYSPPATNDLVGLYATDLHYGGTTEIASPGDLMKVLNYRKSIDVKNLIETSKDATADMYLIPLGFSIQIPEEKGKGIQGYIKCYNGTSPISTEVSVDLNNITDSTYVCGTDTENGQFKIECNDLINGNDYEITFHHFGDTEDTSQQGTLTFTYNGGYMDIGVFTIYSSDTNLNYLDVGWSESNIGTAQRIVTVIEDANTHDQYFKTFKWGDFKLPKGEYNVWLEYFNTSNMSTETSNTQQINFTTTGESTSIVFDIP